MAVGNITVDHFRVYNDGAEASATAIAAEDTAASVTLSADKTVLLRLKIENKTQDISDTYGLQVSRNGGAAATISAGSSYVKGVASANLTDGANTTQQLTLPGGVTYDTTAGVVNNTSATSGTIALTVGHGTSLLFALNLTKADLADGDTLDFTLLKHGGEAVTQFAGNVRITISIPTSPPALTTPPPGSRLDLRLYDTAGKRLTLADITALEFETLARGGYGKGSFETIANWENFILSGGERGDVYALPENVIVYRGYVNVPERAIDASGERATPTLYGRMERCNRIHVSRAYAYTSAADLSTLFTSMVTNDLTPILPSMTTDIQSIGVTVNLFDQIGKTLREAFDSICDMAPNQAIWGFDTDAGGNDRIYLRPQSATVAYRVSVLNGETENLNYSSDLSAIVNRVKITGGKVTPGNLQHNGSFEQPRPSSDTVGNLVLNNGFEDHAGTYWSSITGTIQFPGNGGAHGSSRSGSSWLECDSSGEKGEQVIPIVVGRRYRLGVWARLEDGTKPNSFLMELEGLDVSNVLVTSVTQGINSSLSAPSSGSDYYKSGGKIDSELYGLYYLDQYLATHATVVKMRIRISAQGGSAADDGILFDDVFLVDLDSPGQDGWLVNTNGNATIDTLDWAATTPAARHGGYSVKMKAANISVGTDYIQIYVNKADFEAAVQPSEHYKIGVWVQTNSLGTCDFSFGATNRKSDRSNGTTVQSPTYTAANGSTWVLYQLDVVTGTDAVNLQAFVRCRSNATLFVDDIMIVQGDLPDEYVNKGGWWDGDTYQTIISTTNADLLTASPTAISSAAAASITNYGYCDGDVSNENVTDYTTAVNYAAGYFNAHAIPQVQSPLTVNSPGTLIGLSGTVKMLNLSSAPAAAFPKRIHTEWRSDGFVQQQIELTNEQPELADLLRVIDDRAVGGGIILGASL